MERVTGSFEIKYGQSRFGVEGGALDEQTTIC